MNQTNSNSDQTGMRKSGSVERLSLCCRAGMIFRRFASISVLPVTLVLALTLPALAEGRPEWMLGEPSTQFVLDGLKSVYVSVGSLEELKLDRAKIAADIESKFQQAGLKTIERKDFLNHTDNYMFFVKVTPLKDGRKVFYSLHVGLTQMVYLPEKDSRKVDITTWQDEAVGLVDSSKHELISQRILERVDAFIDLWRRANGDGK